MFSLSDINIIFFFDEKLYMIFEIDYTLIFIAGEGGGIYVFNVFFKEPCSASTFCGAIGPVSPLLRLAPTHSS